MIDWSAKLAPFRGLIFDCDGTLTDSMPLHFEAWQAAMAPFGIEFSEPQFYRWAGKPTTEIIRLLSQHQGVAVDVEKASMAKESHFKTRINDVTARDEVVAVVRQMHGSIGMSVASGGDHDVVNAQLRCIGLTELLPIVVAAEDTAEHKPHPAPFLVAAERMGVAPVDCLVWEDSDLGLDAAAAASMTAIDVRGGIDQWVWHHPG